MERNFLRSPSSPTTAPSAEEHVVLGITIDSLLTFFSLLNQLCKKVSNKLNALTSYFLTGQLSYFPLILSFCSRQSNHVINKFQEQALGIIYCDYDSSFSELLEMSNESAIHIKNINVLTAEIYKFLYDLSPQ